jgi:hypothetical protein
MCRNSPKLNVDQPWHHPSRGSSQPTPPLTQESATSPAGAKGSAPQTVTITARVRSSSALATRSSQLIMHGGGCTGMTGVSGGATVVENEGAGSATTESRPTSTTWPPLPVSHGGPWPRHSSSDRTRSLTRPNHPATRDLACRNAVAGIGSGRRLGRRFAPPNRTRRPSLRGPRLHTRRRTIAGEGARRRHGPSKPPPDRNTLQQQRSATTQLPETRTSGAPANGSGSTEISDGNGQQ